jgi:hypothetical protein
MDQRSAFYPDRAPARCPNRPDGDRRTRRIDHEPAHPQVLAVAERDASSCWRCHSRAPRLEPWRAHLARAPSPSGRGRWSRSGVRWWVIACLAEMDRTGAAPMRAIAARTSTSDLLNRARFQTATPATCPDSACRGPRPLGPRRIAATGVVFFERTYDGQARAQPHARTQLATCQS